MFTLLALAFNHPSDRKGAHACFRQKNVPHLLSFSSEGWFKTVWGSKPSQILHTWSHFVFVELHPYSIEYTPLF
jgi:hypothetical protein